MLVVVAGCGSTKNTTPSAPPKPADAPGVIIGVEELSNLDPALRDAASWQKRVTYVSRSGVNDAYTHVTQSVFVPNGSPPPGGFASSPSAMRGPAPRPTALPRCLPAIFNASSTVEALLKAGSVVTVPDYQGLGNPSDGTHIYHPYLDSTTAGYNMIDSVRAAHTLLPQTSTSWAALGVLQGGQEPGRPTNSQRTTATD